ncbi:hypothetical protein HMSSN036_60920 [Paenibacillus macerans]|nr:hypothetical protein HMSSN036_60920 [Paenibacillus macerans]
MGLAENTLLFLLLTLPPLIVFSLLVAVLLNRKLRFRNAVRTISIIPYVLIPAVVGIIWNWLYDNNFGILNYYLKAAGLGPVEWLTSEKWALLSIAIVTVWTFLGYNMILYLAGCRIFPPICTKRPRSTGRRAHRLSCGLRCRC